MLNKSLQLDFIIVGEISNIKAKIRREYQSHNAIFSAVSKEGQMKKLDFRNCSNPLASYFISYLPGMMFKLLQDPGFSFTVRLG